MSNTVKRVFVSYSSPEQDVDARKLETILGKEKFDVWSDYTTPPALEQEDEEWRREAISGADAVLVLMSNAYQSNENCKLQAEMALEFKKKTGKPIFGFIKVDPNLKEGDWLVSLKGRARTFDVTGASYDRNIPVLINSLKRQQKPSETGPSKPIQG